jgi:hypothetical protein
VPIPRALGDSLDSTLVRLLDLLRRCRLTDAVRQAGPDRHEADIVSRLASSSRPVVAPDPRRLRPEGLDRLGLVKLVALDRWTEPCLDKAMHLSRARMALEGRLREEQLSIEPDLEPAPAAGQQRRPGDPWRPRIRPCC